MSYRQPDRTDFENAILSAGGSRYVIYRNDRAEIRLTPPRGTAFSTSSDDREEAVTAVFRSFCGANGVQIAARFLPVADGFEVDEYRRRLVPSNVVLSPGEAKEVDRWRGGLLNPNGVLSYWNHDRPGCTSGWVRSEDWWFVCGACHRTPTACAHAIAELRELAAGSGRRVSR